MDGYTYTREDRQNKYLDGKIDRKIADDKRYKYLQRERKIEK